MTDLSNENQALVMSELGQTYWEPDDGWVWLGSADPGDLDKLMNAVRREERERAIAVLRPFANYSAASDPDHIWSDETEIAPLIQRNGRHTAILFAHLRAASSYITQAQGADQ